jgi:hypothetical protein
MMGPERWETYPLKHPCEGRSAGNYQIRSRGVPSFPIICASTLIEFDGYYGLRIRIVNLSCMEVYYGYGCSCPPKMVLS